MKRIVRFFVLALAALAVSCSLFDYSRVVTRRYALVYGVTTYVTSPDTWWNDPNLSYPALDAVEVAAMLAAEGYTVKSRWVDEDGVLYVDGTLVGPVDSNLGEAPTKDTLQNDLASLSGSLGSDDELVFYFSGHGMQNTDATHEFFIPYGGIASELYYGHPYYYGDEDTSVRDDEMGIYFTESIATLRRVVILDTCNSGGFIANTLEVDTTPSTTSTVSKARFSLSTIAKAIVAYASFTTASSTGISAYEAQVLSAAGSGESCYDDTDHEHGAMTFYLLKTAGNGDLNGDGAVTVLEAFSLVKAGIEGTWNTENPGEAFTPHVSGGAVDFVLF